MTSALRREYGVFTSLARLHHSDLVVAARAAEDAGFANLWVADVRGELDVLSVATSATRELTVGSAVLSIWDADPRPSAAAWDAADSAAPGRAVLGVGVSHPGLAARAGRVYDKPLSSLAAYLDVLDEQPGVPPAARLIGANGPKMLDLAAERASGAITQMVTPERTAEQRARLGNGPTLATEVKVVVGGSREEGQALARANLSNYLGLPSYQKNLMSLGYSEDDLADGGSDRLVDALVAGPDPDSILRRIGEHREAGADHVCLHVLAAGPGAHLEHWNALAEILGIHPSTGKLTR